MNGFRKRPRLFRALLLAAVVGLAPGCTLFDTWPFGGLKGSPFTPDQPVKELSVVDGIHVDPSSKSSSCQSGGTVFWGLVRNTGDLDVESASIIIDAFGPTGDLLGSFSGSVFSGEVTAAGDVASLDTASTSLLVDQSGSFEVCSSLPFAAVSRAEGRADGIVIQEIVTQ